MWSSLRADTQSRIGTSDTQIAGHKSRVAGHPRIDAVDTWDCHFGNQFRADIGQPRRPDASGGLASFTFLEQIVSPAPRPSGTSQRVSTATKVAAIHTTANADSNHRKVECSTKFTATITPIEAAPATASTVTADGSPWLTPVAAT